MKILNEGIKKRFKDTKYDLDKPKSEKDLNRMLKAATMGVPFTRQVTMKQPISRQQTIKNIGASVSSSLTPSKATSYKRDLLTSASTYSQLKLGQKTLRRPKSSIQRQHVGIQRLRRPQTSNNNEVNSCEVVIDDLFNMEVQMKSVQGLDQEIGLTANQSQSMRSIPTFNHAKVRKTVAKDKKLEQLDMNKVERLMAFSHYTQYNQSFMIKSLGATQEE